MDGRQESLSNQDKNKNRQKSAFIKSIHIKSEKQGNTHNRRRQYKQNFLYIKIEWTEVHIFMLQIQNTKVKS